VERHGQQLNVKPDVPVTVLDMTNLWPGDGSRCGIPTHEWYSARIWAIWYGGSRPSPEVCYSDDYGSTWETWATISATSAAPLGATSLLIRDTHGNVYYNCTTGSNPGVRGVGRVDAVTKAVTKCFDFYVSSGLAGPTDWDTTVQTWGWTIDSEGSIYIGQYTRQYWNGATWVTPGATDYDAHYIWKGDDTGATWERIDYFVENEPDARHVHAVHCNPYDDTLWVNVGDNAKETYYSTDGAATFTKVASAAASRGFTGLTFTTERTYFGDDLGASTKIWATPDGGRSPLAISYSPPEVWQEPIYYLRAVGKRELWCSFFNDAGSGTPRSALVRLTSEDSVWTADSVFQAATAPIADNAYPGDLGHDGRGIVPAYHPYIYCRVYGGTQGPAQGVYRVQREVLMPGTALFTVSEARAFDKEQLASGTDYPDAAIIAKEAEIREWFCKIFGVDFVPTTHTAEVHDGDGSNYLILDWPRISAVSAISIDGVALTAAELSTTDYSAGLAIDPVQPMITRRSGTFRAGFSNVAVTYVAGHGTVPERIKRAALQLCLDELRHGNLPSNAADYESEGLSIQFRADGFRDRWFNSDEGQAAYVAYSMRLPGIA
jgi:hypothetical protein